MPHSPLPPSLLHFLPSPPSFPLLPLLDTYLLRHKLEAFVLSDALVGLPKEGVEGLVRRSVYGRSVGADGEGGDLYHPLGRVPQGGRLIQQLAVL